MNGANTSPINLYFVLITSLLVLCSLYYTSLVFFLYTVAIEELKWQTPTIAILPADVDLNQFTANATRTCHSHVIGVCVSQSGFTYSLLSVCCPFSH